MFAITSKRSWGRGLTLLRLVACGALILGACGGEPETVDPPPVPEKPDPEFQDKYKLRVVGNSTVKLMPGGQVTLQVLYTKNDQGLGGQPISFAVKGALFDTKLSRYQAATDAYGFAETTVTAGQVQTSFAVEATAPKDGPVKWAVEVQSKPKVLPPNLEGSYGLTSNFDVKTDFTGSKLAGVLNLLDQISDDPLDPGQYVVDAILAKVDNKAVLVVAGVLKPTLYSEVNKLLFSVAPSLVADLKQLAQDLSAIARKFELVSTMKSATVQPSDKPMLVDHTLDKIAWTLKGKREEHSLTPLAGSAPVAKNVQLTLATDGSLIVAQHTFDLDYGAFLLVALNKLVIPQIDSSATDVTSLLQSRVDCQKVAATMNSTVGLGGTSLWKTACDVALKAIGLYIDDEISNLDNGESELILVGAGKLRDMDADGVLDAFNHGVWNGSLQLEQCVAPLNGFANTFWGKRAKLATP